MPNTQYIELRIGNRVFDVPQNDDIPVVVDFEIEDEDDFRQKKSGSSLNLTVPATLDNSQNLNTFHEIESEDLMPDGGFDNAQDIVMVANGNEIMKGKGFVTSSKKQGGNPLSFEINCYGDNADWVVPNKELTLHDIISAATHLFTKANIEASWAFDGTSESEFYVYAPVRNREPFGEPFGTDDPDAIFRPINARPSLFLYWLLYWGFKQAGYKISSNFFDTDYFRRMVLPWTWDNFLYINSAELDILKFKALAKMYAEMVDNVTSGASGVNVTYGSNITGDEIDNDSTSGGFDNGNTYSWVPGNSMVWEYLSAYGAFGNLIVGFKLNVGVDYKVTNGASFSVWCDFYIDSGAGWVFNSTQSIVSDSAGALATVADKLAVPISFETPSLSPGDKVKCEILFSWGNGVAGGTQLFIGNFDSFTTYFTIDYFKIPLGGTIDFKRYDKLKEYKWLDLLRGTIDAFNLQLNTDSFGKVVTIEPTHNYSLDNDLGSPINPGYHNGNLVDWTDKEDISKVSEIQRFQDYEQQVVIRMKDDGNDGILKLFQDRYQVAAGMSKYKFPDRFRKGEKQIENRFFSPVMHYKATAWKDITGVIPQLICLIPENISNTSNPSSEFTFEPKLAYYKGLVDPDTFGGWNWDGDDTGDLPMMFAVNYHPGGEDDPILTYGDQQIDDGSGGFVLGKGLFKRFFWTRFAIMRHGKRLNSNFNLNNSDVLNQIHREFKMIGESKYQVISLVGYRPLKNESIQGLLWRWHPVTAVDNDNTYPSSDSVLTGAPEINSPDFKYFRLIALSSDIPT